MHLDPCPCGSHTLLEQCCAPVIEGKAQASSAEQLMRSRYTAYALQRFSYIVETWYPANRPENLLHLLEQDSGDTQWQGLTIVKADDGGSTDEAFVTFFARYLSHQQPNWIYETSRFVRENNRWYYIDGVHKIPGRNETCPCGSQKKFKKCCAS